jgi:hypothetical protein
MRVYPIWALILFVVGGAIIAATLWSAGDILLPILTGDAYGRWVILATTCAVATPGIAVGLALIAIAGASRRDGQTGRWKLWAKLLLVLGGALSVSISLLMVTAGQFGSIFADILLFFGWIPLLIGALLILAAFIWGRRR